MCFAFFFNSKEIATQRVYGHGSVREGTSVNSFWETPAYPPGSHLWAFAHTGPAACSSMRTSLGSLDLGPG